VSDESPGLPNQQGGRVTEAEQTYPSEPRSMPPVHVRHDKRANRAVITMPEAHMAMVILTRLLTLEQVAGWDVEPAGDRFYQLLTCDRETIHIAAAD
jgi:hypothetical protein